MQASSSQQRYRAGDIPTHVRPALRNPDLRPRPPAPSGTFGRVLECWDRKHKDYVAIKIVRNIDKYRHAAMIEVGGG